MVGGVFRGVAYAPAALEPFELELLPFCIAQHDSAPSASCELKIIIECETPGTGWGFGLSSLAQKNRARL